MLMGFLGVDQVRDLITFLLISPLRYPFSTPCRVSHGEKEGLDDCKTFSWITPGII